MSSFLQACTITFGQSPLYSFAWLTLLILRALSFPFTVWLTGQIIDEILVFEDASMWHQIKLGALWLLSLTIASAVTPWHTYFQYAIADVSLKQLQSDLIGKLHQTPDLTMLESKSFHDDLSFVQRCLEYTPGNFISTCGRIIENLITSVALIAIVLQVSWLVGLIMLAALLPHALMMKFLAKYNHWNARLNTEPWKEIQYCSLSLNDEAISKESRFFSLGNYLVDKTQLHFDKLNRQLKSARFKSTSYPIPTLLILQLGSVISLLLVLQDFQAGLISAAAIVVVLQSLYGIQSRLEALLEAANFVTYYLLNFNAIFRVQAIQAKIQLAKSPLPLVPQQEVNIRFEDVSFAYEGGPLVLDKISFTWNWGENIALVGPNGSGKSTIVKLLLRFLDPTSGTIYLNNKPLQEYDLEQWRSLISPVFQQFGQYQYSVRENLIFANPNFSDDQLKQLLTQVGLNNWFASLPQGLDTRLGKQFGNTDLSGGQWQKLAIARALAKSNSLMVLDEPTAALDPLVESELYQLFAKICQGKSSLMITHRLGSTKLADKIVVLKEGRIIEAGDHHKLMALKGQYAQMYLAQSSWYDNKAAQNIA